MIYWRITLDTDEAGVTKTLYTTGMPQNINEMPFGLERNDDSGVVATFSDGLEFVDEIKEYIDSKYDLYSLNAKIYIEVEFRRDLEDWSTLINGVLDMETYHHEQFVTTVEIAESDIQKEFTENRNIKYKITPTENVWLDYTPFEGTSTLTGKDIEIDLDEDNQIRSIPLNLIDADGNDRVHATSFGTPAEAEPIDMTVLGSFSYYVVRPENSINISLAINCTVTFDAGLTPIAQTFAFYQQVYSKTGYLITETKISIDFSTLANHVIAITYDPTAESFDKDSYIRFIVKVAGGAMGSVVNTFNFATTSLVYDVDAIDGTVFKAMTIKQAFAAVLAQMLTSTYSFETPIFDTGGEWEKLLLTTGANLSDYIKSGGASSEIETISISFNELLEGITPFAPIGYGIEPRTELVAPVITVDDLSTFYQTTAASLILKDATNVVKAPSNMISNYIKIGSEEQDFEDNEGEEEFNQAQEFSIGVAKKQDIDSESSFRTDSTGINYNLDQQSSTEKDSNGNTDVFLIHCRETISHIEPKTLLGYTYSGLTGDPNYIYNIELSPQYCVRRNYQVKALATIITTTTKELKLAQNYGFANFRTWDAGTSPDINHWENVDISKLKDSLHGLNEYTFDAKLTPEELLIMISNKYAKITFSDENNTYISGYLMSVSDEVSDEIARSIKIIEA